jgi:hypothetical protein
VYNDELTASKWALNSAVECHLHTVEVIGSNPIAPTINICLPHSHLRVAVVFYVYSRSACRMARYRSKTFFWLSSPRTERSELPAKRSRAAIRRLLVACLGGGGFDLGLFGMSQSRGRSLGPDPWAVVLVWAERLSIGTL